MSRYGQKRIRLKYRAHVEMGQSPSSSTYSTSMEDGLPFLQGSAEFGKVTPHPKVYSTASVKVAVPGDILLSVRAPVGELNIADRPFGIGRGLCAISPERDLHRYTWWAIHEAKHQLRSASTGSTYEAVTTEDVENLLVVQNTKEQQRAIADYLDRETERLDALVAAKERLLKLLAEKRRAIITRAVTRGLDPRAPMRDSGVPWLGQIPAHWRLTRLKFVADVRGGLALGKDYGFSELEEYSYVRVANVQDGYLNLDEVKTVWIPKREAENYLLQAGDVLMNEGGDDDKLGRGCVWTGSITPCLHQNHVFAVRPRIVEPEWIDVWASSDTARFHFELYAKRTTNLASISAANLKELPLPVPPREERLEIMSCCAATCERFANACSTVTDTVALLKERRAGLIAAAVAGRLDVGRTP